MSGAPVDALEKARQACGLSTSELWMRYFALGGDAEPLQFEAVLHGALRAADHEHDQVAHALNERFTELGHNHPIAYRADDLPDGGTPDGGTPGSGVPGGGTTEGGR